AYQLMPLGSVFAGTRVASGLLLAGGLLVAVGFVDDRWGMGAVSKLAAQVAAGVILGWTGSLGGWLSMPGDGRGQQVCRACGCPRDSCLERHPGGLAATAGEWLPVARLQRAGSADHPG